MMVGTVLTKAYVYKNKSFCDKVTNKCKVLLKEDQDFDSDEGFSISVWDKDI